MNTYKNLNKMLDYIDNNLENEIEYSKLAMFIGVNEYIMQRIFSFLCNISLADYIRKRRLSNAGADIYNTNEKIIDIAIKYGYDNSTSFSRAFERFHGIKPSQVKNLPDKLKYFPKITFTENLIGDTNIEYSIIEKDELILYGTYVETDCCNIGKDAPIHFSNINSKYYDIYGDIDYGMVEYIDRYKSSKCRYWVLYNKKVDGLKKYIMPKSKYLVFITNSQEAIDIQKTSNRFYLNFFNNCKYTISNLPELEYYHDGITELLVPIEN